MALALDFLESGGIRMEGTFEDLSLGKLLLWLHGDKHTGKLEVKGPDFSQDVYFKDGYAVGTRGGPNENYLGWLLIQRGFIDNETYFSALTQMQEDPKPMGQILLDQGAISLDQLQRGLSLQLQKKLIRLFELENAEFLFVSTEEIIKDIAIRLINPYFLIPNGIRQITDIRRLRRGLMGYANKAIQVKSDPTSLRTLEMVCLEEHETDAMPLLEGWTSVGRFVEQKYLEELPCLLLLSILDAVQLLETGSVTLVPKGTASMPQIPLTPTSPLWEDDDDDDIQSIRQVENKPLYDHHVEETVEESQTDLTELSDEDQQMVVDVEERLKAFEKQNYYRWLGVSKTSTPEELQRSYYDLSRRFHPDRVSGSPIEFLKPKLEAIFAHLTEAYSTLSKEEARQEYDENSSPAARREQDFATKAAQAEVFFRKAQILLKKNAFYEAKEQLKWAVELNPKEGEYKLIQAWCDFNLEPESNRGVAADEAIKAIRATKGDVSQETIHLYVGRIYKTIGRIDKALFQYKEVMNLNPYSDEAKREIRYLSMQKEKAGAKKEGLWGFLTKKR